MICWGCALHAGGGAACFSCTRDCAAVCMNLSPSARLVPLQASLMASAASQPARAMG
jgi:hypothetical protein